MWILNLIIELYFQVRFMSNVNKLIGVNKVDWDSSLHLDSELETEQNNTLKSEIWTLCIVFNAQFQYISRILH